MVAGCRYGPVFSHSLRDLRTRALCGAALAMGRTARQVGLSGRVVMFESLKKRRRGVFRVVSVLPELLDTLDAWPAAPHRPATPTKQAVAPRPTLN